MASGDQSVMPRPGSGVMISFGLPVRKHFFVRRALRQRQALRFVELVFTIALLRQGDPRPLVRF